MKKVKAWAVINKDNEIVFSFDTCHYWIYKKKPQANYFTCLPGMKVIPVLLSPLGRKKK